MIPWLIWSEEEGPRVVYAITETLRLAGVQQVQWAKHPQELISFEGNTLLYATSQVFPSTCFIPSSGFLSETGIKKFEVPVGSWHDLLVLFPMQADWGFDLFAAVFFCLSRYEEYTASQRDAFGRFDARASWAFQNNVLTRPVVDEWLNEWRNGYLSNEKVEAEPQIKFNWSYDIDVAYAWKGKSFLRSVYAQLQHIKEVGMKGVFSTKDPLDVYDEIQSCCSGQLAKPSFFLLAAKQLNDLDRNIQRHSTAFLNLIKRLQIIGQIGWHVSSQAAHDYSIAKEEKAYLEKIMGPITATRMHYISLQIPTTYQMLVELGIREDYSMGYATMQGLRASTHQSFYWYDLQNDSATELLIHPFVYMDANAIFEEKQDADSAEVFIRSFIDRAEQLLVQPHLVFHSHFITEEKKFRQWRSLHQRILSMNDRN